MIFTAYEIIEDGNIDCILSNTEFRCNFCECVFRITNTEISRVAKQEDDETYWITTHCPKCYQIESAIAMEDLK